MILTHETKVYVLADDGFTDLTHVAIKFQVDPKNDYEVLAIFEVVGREGNTEIAVEDVEDDLMTVLVAEREAWISAHLRAEHERRMEPEFYEE